MTNKFPGDDADDFSDLRKSVEELQALLKNRAPLTKASKGWIIGDMSTPPAPDAGGHLYSNGSDPYWVDSNGNDRALIQDPPEDPLQTPVSGPPGLSTPNAWPGTYNPAYGELVQDDLVMLRDKIIEIIDSLTR